MNFLRLADCIFVSFKKHVGYRQVLMQHLDGLDEVQQSHEFEIANLLAATGPF